MATWLLVTIGFCAGAIPFGVIIARGRGVDIRAHGSGNIGATNVTRVIGRKAGAIVLLLDAAKGALPTWLAWHYACGPWVIVATGAAAIIGHCFSPFLGFKGGKGVATALGVFLVLAPDLVLYSTLVFALMLKLTRVPALGSLAAIGALASLCLLRGEVHIATLALGTFVLLVFTHRTNLAKLRRG
ncbi:MAG: glycerol-3-phosphate acyltransferase [Kofleriaceae bacterium]|nr:glycerol-3-phosphate acyltransferase [Kofleriaceae bacterium]